VMHQPHEIQMDLLWPEQHVGRGVKEEPL
jgi:hypothetical protein